MGVAITILVGTMTGTAEMVAQEVQQALEGAGHQAEIRVTGQQRRCVTTEADRRVDDHRGRAARHRI